MKQINPEKASSNRHKMFLPIIIDEAGIQRVEIENECKCTATQINVIHSGMKRTNKNLIIKLSWSFFVYEIPEKSPSTSDIAFIFLSFCIFLDNNSEKIVCLFTQRIVDANWCWS